MIRPNDVQKLSEFRENATDHLNRLADSGGVEILTDNGEPKDVVMSLRAYEELVEQAELVKSLESLDRGMKDVETDRTMTEEVDIRYRVEVTDAAHDAIREHAPFIAVDQHSPLPIGWT